MRPVSFPMSPAKPLPTPTSPPSRRPISPTPPPHFRRSFPHYFVTSSPRSSALPQNRSPLFSIPYTLFSIHNSAHPLYFLKPAHSLPKTPGGSIGISNQFFGLSSVSLATPLESALPQTQTSPPATPIESTRFLTVVHIFAKSVSVTLAFTTLTKHIPHNPIRMNTSTKHHGHPAFTTALTIYKLQTKVSSASCRYSRCIFFSALRIPRAHSTCTVRSIQPGAGGGKACMAHIGIINLAERLLSQSQAQESSPSTPQNPQAVSTPSATPAPAPTLPGTDQFTASTQSNASDATAQAAGLFSVKTLSLFTAAANFILGTPSASAPTAPTLTFIPPPSVALIAAVNSQLQSLNDALAALGLSQQDITVIDRIASALQDFNPTTYTDLLYQLEGLAQSHAPQVTSAPATVTSATGSGSLQSQALASNLSIAAPANAATAASALPKGAATPGASLLQAVVIRFASGNATPAASPVTTINPVGAATRASASNLQLQQVTLTLNNNNAQAAAPAARSAGAA